MNRSIGDENTVLPTSQFSPSPLSPDSMIGHFRVLRDLGSGGMGFVYMVKHEHLETTHALKIIQPSFSSNSEFRRRFLQEAKIMSRLRHPNIVSCTDAGVEQDIYYLVMDYIEGPRGTSMDLQDLFDERLQSGEWFAEDEAIAVAEEICKALVYAHTYCSSEIPDGVVHRDLKPANILLDRDTRLFITDFGLARLIGSQFENSVISLSITGQRSIGNEPTMPRNTSSKNRVGTFDYMSPEQREGRPADRRSDVYAMGAILYELLTGRKVAGVPRAPSDVRKELNPSWDEILMGKCLCYEPADRYSTAEELLRAIQPVKEDLRVGIVRPKRFPEVHAPAQEHFISEKSRSDEADEKLWYYVNLGSRVGPISVAEVKQLVRRKVIDRTTGVWDGAGDWRPAATTELKILFHKEELEPHETPALKGEYVDNRIVWAVVAVLALLSLVELAFNISLPWVIWVLVNVGLLYCDNKRLTAAGHEAPSAGLAFLIPVYLWKRALMLSQRKWYFWSWMAIFAFFSALPYTGFMQTRLLKATAVELVNQIAADNLGIKASCTRLKIDQKIGPSAFAASAHMDNGQTWPVTITESNGHVQVQLQDVVLPESLEKVEALLREDPSLETGLWFQRAKLLAEKGENGPMQAAAEYSKGVQAYQLESFDVALRAYKRAADLDPGFPWSFNNAAWVLATCSDDTVIDGRAAIEYATKAVHAGGDYWGFKNTLAAAYAAAGDFETAIKHAETSLAAAPEPLKEEERKMLESFRRRQRWVDNSALPIQR